MGPWGDSGKLAGHWFQRWLSSDRRKATRQQVSGLVAYYWDGGVAVAHEVREISPAGMFLMTGQRWYPGTLVTMTLQRSGVELAGAEHAISVQTRVIRQNQDGVGLAFIVPETQHFPAGQPREMKIADRKSLAAFLRGLPARPAE